MILVSKNLWNHQKWLNNINYILGWISSTEKQIHYKVLPGNMFKTSLSKRWSSQLMTKNLKNFSTLIFLKANCGSMQWNNSDNCPSRGLRQTRKTHIIFTRVWCSREKSIRQSHLMAISEIRPAHENIPMIPQSNE